MTHQHREPVLSIEEAIHQYYRDLDDRDDAARSPAGLDPGGSAIYAPLAKCHACGEAFRLSGQAIKEYPEDGFSEVCCTECGTFLATICRGKVEVVTP